MDKRKLDKEKSEAIQVPRPSIGGGSMPEVLLPWACMEEAERWPRLLGSVFRRFQGCFVFKCSSMPQKKKKINLAAWRTESTWLFTVWACYPESILLPVE